MRKTLAASLVVFASTLALSACKKEEPAPAAAPPTPPAEPAKPAEPPKPPAEPEKPAEAPKPAEEVKAADPAKAALMDPTKLAEQAPAKFKAKFTTSKGDF